MRGFPARAGSALSCAPSKREARHMSGPLLAVAIAVFGLLASYWFFGMHRRRQAEIEAGVQALANMKWRECVGLVLESLHSDGYQEEHSTRQPGDGGTEFLLKRDGQSVLLS